MPVPEIRRAGDTALLLDAGSLDAAVELYAALDVARAAGRFDADDLVPAARTVLVRGGLARAPRRFESVLREILSAPSPTVPAESATRDVTIDVVYDGADLDEVAQLTGLSVAEVIERHQAARYRVAFTGFAPGFAYLAGGNPRLQVPRRATPRPRIPAGSVGLAGEFSGVYPRTSPGGWQLIGRTAHAMWDLDRAEPAALVPGASVRFRAVAELIELASNPALPDRARSEGAPALRIIDAGMQTLVQDSGRAGLTHLGVGRSGASDRTAFELANRLVGNRAGAAVLELRLGTFAAEAQRTLVVALTGAPRTGTITGRVGSRIARGDQAFRLDAGDTLTLDPPARGAVTVLAIRGGINAEHTLGSASRDTLAGLGPAPLSAGDTVSIGKTRELPAVSAAVAPKDPLPAAGETATLHVIPGPRDDWFESSGLASLTGQHWEVTPRSDRVGVRLQGTALARVRARHNSELPSEGLVAGSIQVPPDGQPVLFLADHPVTGGYPVIAVVVARDLDLAAQLPAGARIQFALEEER